MTALRHAEADAATLASRLGANGQRERNGNGRHRRRQGRPLAARASGRRAARQRQHRRRGRRAAWASRPRPSACTSATPRASSAPTRGPRRSPSPWPAAKSQRHKGGVRPYSTWRMDAPTTSSVAFHGPAKTITSGRRRALVATSALGVSALAASVAHSTLGLGAAGLAWQLLFCSVYLAAGGLCLARAAWVRAERAIWLCLGARHRAARQRLAGRLRRLPRRAPMPSFSDPLWLGAYLGFYPGVVLLGRERYARRGVGMWLDGLLGGLALGAVTAATALQASLVASGRRRQRRRHRRRLPAGRRRPADLPGHHVRRLELATEPLGAGARRRPVRPRRRRHDLRHRQRQRRLARRRAPTTRCGAWRCSYSPRPPGCPRAARPVIGTTRRTPRLPVGLRGDRGRRARLRPERAPEPGRGRVSPCSRC